MANLTDDQKLMLIKSEAQSVRAGISNPAQTFSYFIDKLDKVNTAPCAFRKRKSDGNHVPENNYISCKISKV